MTNVCKNEYNINQVYKGSARMKREESEKLSRSRRCMGRAVSSYVTGKPGRQSTAETPESEDLPLYERYTRLRSMIRCKDIGLKKACFCILPLRQFFYAKMPGS